MASALQFIWQIWTTLSSYPISLNLNFKIPIFGRSISVHLYHHGLKIQQHKDIKLFQGWGAACMQRARGLPFNPQHQK